jgi:hypothetical protein
MTPDTLYAAGIIVVFLLVITTRQFSSGLLEFLITLSRPGATVLLLSLVSLLYWKRYFYTALILALVSVYLLKDVWVSYPHSDLRRLNLERSRDEARFDPTTSVDLQWANGDASHDAPRMRQKGGDNQPLLIFPPSDETLREMSG